MTNKPKVGILSMQRIKNYGSFLQAFGLKSILEELGADVQFVDYHPGSTLVPTDDEKSGLRRKINKGFEALQGNAPLKAKLDFIKYKNNFGSNYYPYLGITEEMNYAPDLDLLIIGSDEVFNCVQNNTNVGFSPELFGQSNHAKKLISYAASFGNTTLNKLQKYHVDIEVGRWLSQFNSLSVRDKNSHDLVEALTGENCKINLDPVLIYDFASSGKVPTVADSHYMMLYGYNNRFTKDECQLIKNFAKQHGLKIYCIGGVQGCCDKFIDTDPFTVIGYFKNADCVVTDTFHGTILSVITHRQFVSLIRTNGYGNSEKLVDLLGRLKLEDRQIADLHNLEAYLRKSIDYTTTDRIISDERIKTREYLKKWL
ncbi:polysaccharide pyruvyl transferase family protein [Galactobacillus timonensis]|uniref:polysaccharide pyruvyl transferase family protein n=1 Tax=Galactobacillus timonensis TaxID=2041840 RepID=UPI000C861E4D|nr:polysaccharide pyruvyl transferase family protein [Galactobacillus timonensis]